MPDYQQSRIYQIVCLTTGECYIGSTTQTLAQRLSGHCRDFKFWKNGTKNGTRPFVSSFTILERNNYRIELIESFPCDSKEQLHAREGFHIRNMVCVNKCIAGRTAQEYREDNKETILEYQKAYRETNKEAISEQCKAYCEANKEAILEKAKAYHQAHRQAILEKKKAYREANKEAISEKAKAYREANKQVLLEKRKLYRAKEN